MLFMLNKCSESTIQVEWCMDVSHTCKDRSEWDYRRGTSLRRHESSSTRKRAAGPNTTTMPCSRSSSQRSRKPASSEPSPRFPPVSQPPDLRTHFQHPLDDGGLDDPDSREDDELRHLFSDGQSGGKSGKGCRGGRAESDDGYDEEPIDCLQCYMATVWYQLAKDLLEYVIPSTKPEHAEHVRVLHLPSNKHIKIYEGIYP
jgi:hypothetical protein